MASSGNDRSSVGNGSALGLSLGLAVGIAFGLTVLDDLSIGIASGMAIGVGLGLAYDRVGKKSGAEARNDASGGDCAADKAPGGETSVNETNEPDDRRKRGD